MNKRMRGRTRAADHRKTHLGAMLLLMFTLAALIAAALIRPAMRTDKPDGDELTNIEIVLDHVDADEGVSRRVLLELMKQRAAEQGRADDTPEAIAKRLETYEKETAPLLDIYEARGLLGVVNGVGDIDEISGRIISHLE